MGHNKADNGNTFTPELGSASDATYEELQIAFENSKTGIAWIDAQGVYRTVRQDYAAMLGYAPDELQGQAWHLSIAESNLQSADTAYDTMLDTGRVVHDSLARRKDGSSFISRLLLVKTTDSDGSLTGFYCFLRDITVWQDIKRAQMNAEEFSSKLLDSMQDGFTVMDAEGRLVRVNAAFTKMIGYSKAELIGAGVPHPYWPKEQRKNILDGFGKPPFEPSDREIILQRKDGSRFPVIVSLFSSADAEGNTLFVATVKDVSAMRETERRLAEAERLKTIGTLAGGIAHDLNNLLTPILGSADMILQGSIGVQKASTTIRAAAERAKELIEQLLAISNNQVAEKKMLSLEKALKDAVHFVRGSLPPNVSLAISGAPSCSQLLGVEARIQLLILNLISNAGDAMKDRGGRIDICLDNPEPDQIRLRVSDNGCGIAPDKIEDIFDPFFTTKSRGNGTGLGLMMVKEAVADHGGDISVESRLSQGSTFTVQLPLTRETLAVKPAELAGRSAQAALEIVVVDDDPAILEISEAMLAHLGHHPTCVSDPQLLLHQDMSDVDLLITDYRMNGTSGVALVRQLQAAYQGPVLLMTGLYDRQDSLPQGIDGRLNKPFKLDNLRSAIDSVTATAAESE